MARYRGLTNLSTTYDITYWGPLDTRMLVEYKSDLTNENTWIPLRTTESSAYTGMIVAVANDTIENNGVYVLIDYDRLTEESSWKKLKFDDSRSGVTTVIVSSTSEIHDPVEGTIYFVTNTSPFSNNKFDEYMYINGSFELLGETPVDVSKFYTKGEVDILITAVQSEINGIKTQLTTFATTEQLQEAINNIPVVDLSGYYTKTDTYSKTEVDNNIRKVVADIESTYVSLEYLKAQKFATEEFVNETVDDLTLDVADEDTLGGIRSSSKKQVIDGGSMTVPVVVDENGYASVNLQFVSIFGGNA